MYSEETNLRDLLSGEVARERRAYKRASILTTIAAVVGIAWLAFSASYVYRLQKKSSELDARIREQTSTLADLQNHVNETTQKLSVAREALESVQTDLNSIQKNLENIASGATDPKTGSQQAIRTVNKASRTISISKTPQAPGVKPLPTPTPQAPNVKPGSASTPQVSPPERLSPPAVARPREAEPAKKKGKKGGEEL